MKTSPTNLPVFSRAARCSAVALVSVALGLAASAQSPSAAGPADQPGTSPSTPNTTTNAATGSGADGTANTSTARSEMGMSGRSSLKHGDKRFLDQVAKGSKLEVAIAQLGTQRATNPQVRDFAQQLVTDHEHLNQQLAQLARQKGVMLIKDEAALTGARASGMSTGSTTTEPTSTQEATNSSTTGSPGMAMNGRMAGMSNSSDITANRHYRSLASKSGADFDKEFVSYMVKDHKQDIKMFQKEAQDAKDPDVRAFASQHVAILQQHLDRADSLSKSAAE